jgi:hypothetical protein
MWEGDMLGIWPAIDMIPTDIILADWHYDMNEKGFAGIGALIEKGFTVISAGWRDLKQTRFLLSEALKYATPAVDNGGRWAGMMITCWSMASDELLAKMLNVLKSGELDEENTDERGIASGVLYITGEL